ncbi:microsomal glutathione S-transferase 3 [Rhodotorula toruloides]|uniref:Glutathione S-transferase 3, mitochondrial n=1 Tax=Rhodotorula toruloides TaxID=5286 RepID=A0A0K3CLT2_RHOTO|nr:microsomal glutathione S-transferase 3 [Rhodotorula toruloides]
MQILTSTLPADFAYVTAVGTVGVYGLLQFATIKVSKARKAAQVAYPAPYAENAVAERDIKAKIFNCTQRAHANTLENLPIFLISLFHTGLYHPVAAAVGGLVWILGRFAYVQGYASGDPKARMRGSFQYLGLIPLFLFSSYKAISSLPIFA